MNNTAQELIAAMQMLENPEQRKVQMGFFKTATLSSAWTKRSASIGWGGNEATLFRTTKPMIDYINRASPTLCISNTKASCTSRTIGGNCK